IDAWRIEVVDESRQGAMAAAYQWGYRVAVLVSGAVPLMLADSFGWRLSYVAMAAAMGLGVAATLAAPREAEVRVRETRIDDVPAVPVRDAIEWITRLVIMVVA